jgi:hypothetical protein
VCRGFLQAYKKFISEQMQMGAAEGLLPPTADMPAPGLLFSLLGPRSQRCLDFENAWSWVRAFA